MSECIFCRIARGEIPAGIVYQDDDMLAFKDINPRARVHVLVIPRLHVASLEDIDESHDSLMARIMRRLPQIAREQGLETGFRTIINTGSGGGQEVFHLHVHLLGGGRLPGFG
ncbi:MAG: histidine triad nucleotide-binding protein [Gammaproteobacteria bacterium RBG_16_57_12]|nr:MAG: histidine triad nucleotide-binding protein [Gammaproteobacteria bacterium RBG_16_57_12]